MKLAGSVLAALSLFSHCGFALAAEIRVLCAGAAAPATKLPAFSRSATTVDVTITTSGRMPSFSFAWICPAVP